VTTTHLAPADTRHTTLTTKRNERHLMSLSETTKDLAEHAKAAAAQQKRHAS
jgi:hypothetical protein